MKVHYDINQFSAKNPVATIGVFDGVHRGHTKLLNRLKEKALANNGESVVITLWPHPRLFLGKDLDNLRLINTLDEKKILMEKAKVDHLVVLPFNRELSQLSACEFTEQILVDKLHIRFLLVGYDHHFGRERKGGYNDLKSCSRQYNFGLERIDAELVNGVKISSTKIREILLNGEIHIANEYLGYQYFIKGYVVGGNRVGQKLGFPTANVEVQEPYKLIPHDGVYAVIANINGKTHKGMLNIGYRPTFDKYGSRKSIEVHLFDFEEDIYHKEIYIHFVKRIREEKKFEGVEELVNQLEKDKKTAMHILNNPF
ncbi:MAG: bifunctional riboflavin kinase/FAD synthetase [Bacteroidota bacterium]